MEGFNDPYLNASALAFVEVLQLEILIVTLAFGSCIDFASDFACMLIDVQNYKLIYFFM